MKSKVEYKEGMCRDLIELGEAWCTLNYLMPSRVPCFYSKILLWSPYVLIPLVIFMFYFSKQKQYMKVSIFLKLLLNVECAFNRKKNNFLDYLIECKR